MKLRRKALNQFLGPVSKVWLMILEKRMVMRITRAMNMKTRKRNLRIAYQSTSKMSVNFNTKIRDGVSWIFTNLIMAMQNAKFVENQT